MKFKIGDKIVIKEKRKKQLLKKFKNSDVKTKTVIIETVSKNVRRGNSFVKITIADSSTTIPVYLDHYRLATEAEIKADLIKNIFKK